MDVIMNAIPEFIGGLALTIITVLANKYYKKYKASKNKESSDPSKEEIEDIDKIFQFRNNHRPSLTKLTKLYYEKRNYSSLENKIIGDLPVLIDKNYLPETPFPVSDLDKNLIWDNKTQIKPKLENDIAKKLQKASSGKKLYDGYIYRLLSTNGKSFGFTEGRYFDFLNTCEYLSYEIAETIFTNKYYHDLFIEGTDNSIEKIANFLIENPKTIPFRAATDPFDYSSRMSAFGTCALVVIKRSKKESVFVLNERSNQLAETPNLLHVIPAGTFQPNNQNNIFHKHEFSFSENIYREFIEELIEDVHIRQDPEAVLDFNLMYGEKGTKIRKTIIEPNNFDLIYLGMVMDPVNLKPEILTVLLLHEGYFQEILNHKKELAPSWETKSTTLRFINFNKEAINKVLEKDNIVPTGKSHLKLTLHHYDFLLEKLGHI